MGGGAVNRSSHLCDEMAASSDAAAGVATAIDVADLPAATYLLRIEAEGTSAAYVIIKE